MLTTTAITALKQCFTDNIAYAKFKVGDTYYKSPIQSAEILIDGRVAITFLIDHTISGTIAVTEVQLYDHSGRLWASKVESITRKAAQEGILYRFAITITES